MLIIPRSETNPIAVLDFDSLEDCEATVDHVTAEPVPDFEIVSLQTNDDKGNLPPE